MKQLFLALSLLFSANLICEENDWSSSGPTYEDILQSYSISGLKKVKLEIETELAQCNNPKKTSELLGKLNSVEKTITSMKKSAEQELENYRKEVQGYSLKELELARDAYKRSLNIDQKYIDEIRKQTNSVIEQQLTILEFEIKKRKQAQ